MGNAAGLDVGLRNLHSLDKGKVVIFPGAVGSGGSGLQHSQALCPSRDTASQCSAGVWENVIDLSTGAELSSASGWDWREHEDVGDRQDHKMRKISGSQTQKDSIYGKEKPRRGKGRKLFTLPEWATSSQVEKRRSMWESGNQQLGGEILGRCHLLQETSPGELG